MREPTPEANEDSLKKADLFVKAFTDFNNAFIGIETFN